MLSKRLVSVTCAALLAGCVCRPERRGRVRRHAHAQRCRLDTGRPDRGRMGRGLGHGQQHPGQLLPGRLGNRRKDIAKGLVDFGASDAPLSVYPTAPANLVQIPWALTATGVSYHLNGLKPKGSSLKLTGTGARPDLPGTDHQLEQPRDQEAEQGRARSPSTKITVFWRSDGSGDTYAFTRYLSDVSSHVLDQGRQLDHGRLPGRSRREGQRGHGAGARRRPTAGSPTSRSRT